MKAIIGLEVHVELKTKSKMFCECPADWFGKKPNTNTCPVCLGLPGALPIPNKKAIEWCVMLGLALNCKTPLFSKFDRKNYFYPDLPKGYQISQYDQPFCVQGKLKLSNGKTVRIRRIHMEEDTGKMIHARKGEPVGMLLAITHPENMTLIDFNRSGVPLVEIVTEPEFDNADDVAEYLKKLQQIARYLEISDADMEKGQMRLEPNISVSGSKKQYKVEVKNINSFSFVEKAINYELKRQQELIDKGETPVQETRGWDEKKQKTISQRVKEEASDYRYFPEPDIPPITWTTNQISSLKSQIPELPNEKFKRFIRKYFIKPLDIEILLRNKKSADYFEEAVKIYKSVIKTPEKSYGDYAQLVANYIINRKINIEEILPAQLVQNIEQAASTVQIDEKKLNKIIEEVIKENERAVSDYKKGKENAIMFLVGQVMRRFPQKIDASTIKASLLAKLKNG